MFTSDNLDYLHILKGLYVLRKGPDFGVPDTELTISVVAPTVVLGLALLGLNAGEAVHASSPDVLYLFKSHPLPAGGLDLVLVPIEDPLAQGKVLRVSPDKHITICQNHGMIVSRDDLGDIFDLLTWAHFRQADPQRKLDLVSNVALYDPSVKPAKIDLVLLSAGKQAVTIPCGDHVDGRLDLYQGRDSLLPLPAQGSLIIAPEGIDLKAFGEKQGVHSSARHNIDILPQQGILVDVFPLVLLILVESDLKLLNA